MTRTVRISFVISTSGRRRDTVQRLYQTIRDSIPDPKEIVLVGAVGDVADPAVKAVDARQDALAGRICTMRNLGGEASAGEILTFLDDDVEIDESWYPAARPLLVRLRSGTADIGNCRIIGPNGKRWFDWCWASREDPDCPPMLLPYGLVHPNLYVSGCCMIMRRDVWSSVLFDEKLLNHQHDDVDFCHRCTDAGYRFSSQPSATLTHLLEPAGRNPEDPASGPDEFSVAVHKYREGSPRDALELLEKAEGKVQQGVYHYYKGLFLLFLRDIPAAEKHLLIAQEELDANTHRALCGQVRYRLGLVALMRKATQESERMFRAALELVPEHPFARARLRRLNGKPMALPS